MALFPAFAEVETKRAEDSAKGGKYFLYDACFHAWMIISPLRISAEPFQVLVSSK